MIDRIKGLESGFVPKAEALKEKALDYSAAAREQWSAGERRLRDLVVEHPARALAVAVGMGVILGWLIKRR